MGQISRATQQIFGSAVAGTSTAVFGSLKAGAAAYSNVLATIQSLGAWAQGWANAVVNNNAPALEDMNSLFYLITTQLAYIFQAGVPEWDAGTTYYLDSVVMDTSSGATGAQIYQATSAASNLNQPPHSSPTYWVPLVQAGTVTPSTGGTTGAVTSTCDAQLGASFSVGAGAGGSATITINDLIDGQTINILKTGAAGNVITFAGLSGLTQHTGITYSNTMTSTYSMFTLTRIGTFVIINALHGIS